MSVRTLRSAPKPVNTASAFGKVGVKAASRSRGTAVRYALARTYLLSAVDTGIVPERREGLHALQVEAVPDERHERQWAPEGHRITEMVSHLDGDERRRLGRNVIGQSRRRPLRERLVQPRVARLVVADE